MFYFDMIKLEKKPELPGLLLCFPLQDALKSCLSIEDQPSLGGRPVLLLCRPRAGQEEDFAPPPCVYVAGVH